MAAVRSSNAVSSAQPWVLSYWQATADGSVSGPGSFGLAQNFHLNQPIVGVASTPDGGGYWLVAADGGVFSVGDAVFHGSEGGVRLNQPIVGMASTPDGGGYWLVAADGGVFSFGDAKFHGSEGGTRLNQPITGMASAPDGGGYWLVAADGGVFTFGDAKFHGSEGGVRLNAPIVGIAPTSTGGGYWLDGSDGGVFTFGDAGFFGSAPAGNGSPAAPGYIVGAVIPTPDQQGYWLVPANFDGCVGFGDAQACPPELFPFQAPGQPPFVGPHIVAAVAVGGSQSKA
ncbi:MAG TPA: hypothetical protein VG298_07745 [Acidimicrobiales bacterium]|nr:hypothetical protein [Acidimicrobiales bacterium]